MGVEMTRTSLVPPKAFFQTLTLRQSGGRGTSRLRAYGESPHRSGSRVLEGSEMGWGGQSGILLDHRGCSGMALEGSVPTSPTPSPPALMNTLNSGIAPRGPCPRH